MVNIQLTEDQPEALEMRLEGDKLSNCERLLVDEILLKIRMMRYTKSPVLGYLNLNQISKENIGSFKKEWHKVMTAIPVHSSPNLV